MFQMVSRWQSSPSTETWQSFSSSVHWQKHGYPSPKLCCHWSYNKYTPTHAMPVLLVDRTPTLCTHHFMVTICYYKCFYKYAEVKRNREACIVQYQCFLTRNCVSPGVLESLFTCKPLTGVFAHQIPNEVLCWNADTESHSFICKWCIHHYVKWNTLNWTHLWWYWSSWCT